MTDLTQEHVHMGAHDSMTRTTNIKPVLSRIFLWAGWSDSLYYVQRTSILKDRHLMIKNHHGVWEIVRVHLDRLTTNTETHNIITSVMSITCQNMGQHTIVYCIVGRVCTFFLSISPNKKKLEQSRIYRSTGVIPSCIVIQILFVARIGHIRTFHTIRFPILNGKKS